MYSKYLSGIFVLFLSIAVAAKGHPVPPAQLVCGKWESVDKNLIIQVFMDGNQYKAKIVWFSDTDGKPMSYWRDVRNPDPKLRSRRILGMGILTGLVYDSKRNSWEDGEVYDSRHGRTWNASASIDKNGDLKVRGYWHFKFIGKTLAFKRCK